MFAEFLLFLLVFPWGHACVGLTVVFECFSSFLVCCSVPSLFGAVKVRWVVRSEVHACKERGGGSLITHISRVTPMLAWDGLVELGG